MKKVILSAGALLLSANLCTAQNTQAKDIFSRYEDFRPSERELTMYQLDWAESLEVALERAAKESRPIFLIIIHAHYGDIFSGHC
ncbi:MAG: hypothetical protein OSB65_09330 [Roseibacillus sp.]|jgi:hypothetical protein|nr:hypothetical protein [Roseibacillus sp.]|tara:strand:+ start:395 stop:649 length:255 start_codon:yes stop_codon:yes gene_type:complete